MKTHPNNNQTKPSSNFCKNHPDVSSFYFLTDHPQTRYCKKCALNVALCGRRIQQELTALEQQRKQLITSISVELQGCMEVSKMNQGLFSKLQQYAQEMTTPLASRLLAIEKVICQLTNVKNQLQFIFDEDIKTKVQMFRSMVESSQSQQNQIQRTIEEIESNISDLISLEEKQSFQAEQLAFKGKLDEYKEVVLVPVNFQGIKMEMKQKYQHFVAVYQTINDIKIGQFQYLTNDKDAPYLNEFALTPIDMNTLESSCLLEELKINLTANAQTKCKKKHPYDPKKTNRKTSHQVNQNAIPSQKKSLH